MRTKTELLDAVCAALGNTHRRRIVEHLSIQPASISQLANAESLSLQAIHKHIALLEDAALIRREKRGRTTFLAIRREGLRALSAWTAQFNPHWGSDAEQLTNYSHLDA